MIDYARRREAVFSWMRDKGVDLVIVEDFEDGRSPALRYLSGHPMDALLFLTADGQSVLVPWDVILAEKTAQGCKIIPYTNFDRDKSAAIKALAEQLLPKKGGNIELPPRTTHADYENLSRQLSCYTLFAREEGVNAHINLMRAVKDAQEIALYRKIAEITNNLIDEIVLNVQNGNLSTEVDVALFIERQTRQRGCDGTGFETLCAGPSRSFGIHCFPSYTAGEFASKGMSILDFGIVYQGYTSDVTLTFVRNASPEQKKMLSLVEKAAQIGIEAVKPGASAREPACLVADFFKEAGYFMPHGLGHGIGLEAHEPPRLSTLASNKWILQKGMIVTVEPGLYNPSECGCRLENDVLVTENGNEVLTKLKIVYL